MTAIEKVISLARAELGYREKASNAQLDDQTANAGPGNFTKYARDLDAIGFYNGPKQGHPYCAVFHNWLFVRAFGAYLAKKMLFQPDSGSLAAGCEFAAGYYIAEGQFYAAPVPGDQIFFGPRGGNHTGLVTRVDGSRVYTIEGNTSDGVYERSYARSDPYIYGYGRPDWSLVTGNGDDRGALGEKGDPYEGVLDDAEDVAPGLDGVSIPMRELYNGCVGEDVRASQLLLIGRGYPCGPDGADGEFGPNTKTAVLKYQQLHGLDDDGVVGVITWTSLLTRQ